MRATVAASPYALFHFSSDSSRSVEPVVEILHRLAIGLLGFLDLRPERLVLLLQPLALLLGRGQFGLQRGALILERARLRRRVAQRLAQAIGFRVRARGGRGQNRQYDDERELQMSHG